MAIRQPAPAGRIVRNARVLDGEPIVRGTRIPVRSIVLAWREYGGLEGVLDTYPQLTATDVEDALSFYTAHQAEIERHIRANLMPPASLRHWRQLVEREEESGDVPLPIVDTLRLDDEHGQITAFSLVSRTLGGDIPHLMVRHDQMAHKDVVAVHGLLDALERTIEFQSVTAIYHLGGLDFLLADRERELPLSELDERTWRTAWSLLHALALIGEQYPDREASTPKVVEART